MTIESLIKNKNKIKMDKKNRVFKKAFREMKKEKQKNQVDLKQKNKMKE